MVKLSVEVRKGAARFRVSIRAPSIERAIGLVGERYPESAASVQFPIDPEGFIAADRGTRCAMVGRPERAAA